MVVSEEYPALKRNIGLAEREILTMVYIQYFEKFSAHRLPDCNWSVDRSHRVTIAPHEEVGVSTGGHASAPPSGASASMPPSGA
jgi:hypothetical protein